MARPKLRIRPNELRRRRLEAVLSRRQLAHLSGISRRRIDELEAGPEGINPETARKLASALDCPVHKITEVVDSGQAA
jgi:transcriptional regulator with XRE-family HTH domain